MMRAAPFSFPAQIPGKIEQNRRSPMLSEHAAKAGGHLGRLP